ncbi:hypothetical protein [Nocardia transvalensis]|uniref:hypothetical protein n=1 Tax=Nocardia transvalensis TaxID=37333 RepID=UPI0018958F73|nr:hypothetical protein [Nocardia transvalensis]MBF6333587.1 hypothetical protein [Nocardia transvalensis]
MKQDPSPVDTFPPLPSRNENWWIEDIPNWRYPSACAAGFGIAHLRAFGDVGADLVIVSERGIGASVTNSAEYIWAAVAEDFGDRNGDVPVLLEHWPAGAGATEEEHLDQVVVVDGVPRWRPIWPVPETNPNHGDNAAWMQAVGRGAIAGLASGPIKRT